MAVYTDVADDELRAFIALYDIGEVLSCKGIAEGVENSNFLRHHRARQFHPDALRKAGRARGSAVFHRADGASRARRASPARRRCKGADGDRVARAVRPPGGDRDLSRRNVAAPHPALPLRRRSAPRSPRLHRAGASFGMTRANDLSVAGWRRLYEACRARAAEVQPGLADELAAELALLEAEWPHDLPTGVIHADLFPDNVFFREREVSGLIDFYFACTDFLAYDLAICLNAWCFEADGSLNVTKARLLLEGYRRARPLAVGRARRAAAAGARQRAALSADPAVRLAEPAGGGVGPAEGSARISAQAALPPRHHRYRGVWPRCLSWPRSKSSPTARAAATRARAAGPRSCAIARSRRN